MKIASRVFNQTLRRTAAFVSASAFYSLPAWADNAPPKIDSGDTAWMLASTALVLMMTVPGLALFYAGMVRKKNVLATMMQSFSKGNDTQAFTLAAGTDVASATTIPETVYMMFQMTFAIITPALISGAFADRMKFS